MNFKYEIKYRLYDRLYFLFSNSSYLILITMGVDHGGQGDKSPPPEFGAGGR